MRHDLELKVQAWLDGELPQHQARRTAEWIARDAEAAALAAELGGLRRIMAGQETAAALGASREFYWSKIERQIQRQAGLDRPAGLPWSARWRPWATALAGVAGLAGVLLMALRQAGSPTFDEISATSEGMEAVTFHDQSAQMTVVWLQENSPAAKEDQPVQKEVRFHDEPDSVIDLE